MISELTKYTNKKKTHESGSFFVTSNSPPITTPTGGLLDEKLNKKRSPEGLLSNRYTIVKKTLEFYTIFITFIIYLWRGIHGVYKKVLKNLIFKIKFI